MIAADIGRALVLASVPLAYLLDALTMPQLYAVAFLTGTLSVFFDLSWSTIFVSIVPREHYVDANSKLFQSRSLAYVAGPSIAGALVQVFKAPFALAADALSFLVSAAFLTRVHAVEPEPAVTPRNASGRASRRGVASSSRTPRCARRCSRSRRSTSST